MTSTEQAALRELERLAGSLVTEHGPAGPEELRTRPDVAVLTLTEPAAQLILGVRDSLLTFAGGGCYRVVGWSHRLDGLIITRDRGRESDREAATVVAQIRMGG